MADNAIDIQEIVREVMARLEAAGVAGRSTAPAACAAPQPAPAPAPAAPAARTVPEGELSVRCRVVTMAEVGDRLQGVRRLVVAPGAGVTPSVREELEKRKIRLVSAETDAKPVAQVALVAVGTPIDPEPLAKTLQRDGASVATEKLDCVIVACDTLAGRIAAGGTLGVLLTAHTAAALCLANRKAGVRAVLGVRPDTIAADAAAVGANLLVIDPAAFGFFTLKQIVDRYLQRGCRPCPLVFQKKLA
jgi:hypothetical protein